MTTLLQIHGDPTFWVLGDGAPADAIQQGLNGQGHPIVVPVDGPLKGRLVLSAKASASVAVLTPPVGGIPGGVILPRGWIPGGWMTTGGQLYVPSAAGPTSASPGYTLPASLDLARLEDEIITAMTHGTTIAIEVAAGIYSGSLHLNGGMLSFAVISPPGA